MQHYCTNCGAEREAEQTRLYDYCDECGELSHFVIADHYEAKYE